jgi:hypothetical protein
MPTLDLKQQFKEFYQPSAKTVSLVEVPTLQFILIDGIGAPGSPQFQQAVEALYSTAYTVNSPKSNGKESITGDGAGGTVVGQELRVFDPQTEDRNLWQWTLMIMQPGVVSKIDFESGRESAPARKPSGPQKRPVGKFHRGPGCPAYAHGAFCGGGSQRCQVT